MMGQAMIALVCLTGVAHLVSALRLACYQRDEAHHCWGNRLLTSLCGGLFCLAGLNVLLTGAPVSPWHALVSVFACALILRSSGNIVLLWQTLK
ncbi:hypothetical protein PS662_04473 [Pseudomonas fluorescens]|uniref:Phage holin family protein n=1 Tax=Pseudomonas fluorescens TaxID=294 RepID=A0A5E6W390_PSEFL|nr:phage holin family protein [Pseudomonas fluorescens]VVN23129.1 hypothetical protein PS662_04473 [Pseudomonas fluorescens]